MKQLVLRNEGREMVNRIACILLLVSGGIQIIISDPGSWRFWFSLAYVIFLAAFLITHNFGTLINRLAVQDQFLVVRWYSKILKKRIPLEDISGITGDDDFIRIILKSGKPVKLPVKMLDPQEIRSVYKFLEENRVYQLA